MTLNEFKAWLDGFAEAMGDAPSPEQWSKIKAKLGDVVEFHVPSYPSPIPRTSSADCARSSELRPYAISQNISTERN